MAEWYRLGMPFTDLISETMDFIRLFIGQLPSRTISYRQAFQDYAELDYLTASSEEILHCLRKHHIEAYPDVINEGRDALLNLVLGTLIEPQLGQGELIALAYYPASQAALAQTIVIDGEAVCERFEIYYQGIELCNGYHELADPIEQRKRLEDSNHMRIQLGKNTLPIDEFFLKALKKGLPDCCGVAVGFDRLMMLRHKAKHIKDVISFDWSTA